MYIPKMQDYRALVIDLTCAASPADDAASRA